MPYEKCITVYENIPIDKIKGQVSRTELVICEVVNEFVDEVRENNQDEGLDLLSWDQVLMMSDRYYSSSVLGMILLRIETRLREVFVSYGNSDVWERGYYRREILLHEGYIFGDPIMRPYCPEGIKAWVFAEEKVMWLEGIIDQLPAVVIKAELEKLIDEKRIEREKVLELLAGDPKSVMAEQRFFQVALVVIQVIKGYGINVSDFKTGKWLKDKEGNKKKILFAEFHQDCLKLSPKNIIPQGEVGFRELWKKKVKKILKSMD